MWNTSLIADKTMDGSFRNEMKRIADVGCKV